MREQGMYIYILIYKRLDKILTSRDMVFDRKHKTFHERICEYKKNK